MSNKFYFLVINFIKFLIKLLIPNFIRGKLSFIIELDTFEFANFLLLEEKSLSLESLSTSL